MLPPSTADSNKMAGFQAAMTARSLRTVRAELEFLAETNVITASQLSSILSNLPASDISSTTTALASSGLRSTKTDPVPVASPTSTYNEKASFNPTPTPSYPSAPPAYSHPPTLSVVTALYPYSAADSGDLALQPNDTINVTEYVNEDWWRGVNPITGQTGIFPKAYVKAAPGGEKEGYGYGNVPLQVANSGSSHQPQPPQGEYVGPPEEPSKFEQGGKKFGKKLGNAAIFGAGATIGGKIVNGIF